MIQPLHSLRAGMDCLALWFWKPTSNSTVRWKVRNKSPTRVCLASSLSRSSFQRLQLALRNCLGSEGRNRRAIFLIISDEPWVFGEWGGRHIPLPRTQGKQQRVESSRRHSWWTDNNSKYLSHFIVARVDISSSQLHAAVRVISSVHKEQSQWKKLATKGTKLATPS